MRRADWPRALIFDVDGTLAETEALHLRAFNLAFAGAGLDWNWSAQAYRALLTTTGGKERITRFIREQGGDPAAVDVAGLHRAKTALYGRLMGEGAMAPRAGIAALLADARSSAVPLAIATTTAADNVGALCHALFGCAADTLFQTVAAGDMVAAKKPAPDVYLLALQQLGLAAADCVALEDSRNGVMAARAAGVPVILSQGDFTEGEDAAGADVQVQSFADVDSLAKIRARFGAIK